MLLRQQVCFSQVPSCGCSGDRPETSFEDDLSKQYRQVARSLPIEALLWEQLTSEKQGDALDDFYRYIDLTNEQVFLRVNGRVARATWRNWVDGKRVTSGVRRSGSLGNRLRHVPHRVAKSFGDLKSRISIRTLDGGDGARLPVRINLSSERPPSLKTSSSQ